ncbi:ABC transporter ATP-binding protein [Williamsia sterculiae]|uniref:Iron complex transport system ATP-binding protein n=1 Tax=Williamsia sterculiae TaxID=1344003 RepID=A0A1N7H1R4_9NOCA|nr:ABC transporter ATP-binding protein [Williamsia sterculiae]SIS18765.1 iron complex transport system ATP-binding protein [Williamsia sterculiae]
MNTPAPAVDYREVTVRLGHVDIVTDIHLSVGEGRFFGLIGPNGGGKSTILRCLYRALTPVTGAITLNGRDVAASSLRANARHVAALTQSSEMFLDFTVEDVVRTGRLPHTGLLRSTTTDDTWVCDQAMDEAGVGGLRGRLFSELSGGESQRVLIARAFAQQTPVLVLDEPTNHLDVRHQYAVLEAARNRGTTVIAALHDLNVAARFCTDLAVVAGGRVVRTGTPADVLTAASIGQWFGIGCHVVRHPRLSVPQIIFDEGLSP